MTLSEKPENLYPNPVLIQATKQLIKQRKPDGKAAKERQKLARKSLRDFAAYVNPRFEFYPHANVLISVLERVASRELNRVIIQMPPRHGKSELVSRIFPAYYLLKYPQHFVGLASYSYELAGTLSRMARENYLTAGGSVRDDAGSIKHWETQAGGGMWTVGTGGSATGKGYFLGLVDDPLKDAEEANSAITRDKVMEWYNAVFYTRAEPDAAIVIVQTRWHEDDLVGRLLSKSHQTNENWHVVSMPALYEPDHKDQFPTVCTLEPDFRTQEGQALCPARYSEKRLESTRMNIGGYHFEALYQQRPTAVGGTMFDVTKLEFVDVPPVRVEKVARGWDKASTADGGDYTAGVKMLKGIDGVFYVVDVVRGQWNTATRDAEIRIAAEIDGRDCRIIGEQEPGSGGKDSAVFFVKNLGGFSVATKPSSGSKELRADPFSSQVNAGNVRIVRGDWNAAFIEELRQFPRGRHDDQVDAASLAFTEVSKKSAKYYNF